MNCPLRKMDVDMFKLILQWLLYLTVFSIALFYWFVHRNFQYWKDRGIIYEKPSFPLGNLGFIMRKSFWDFCYELKNKHTRDYVGVFLAWKPALFVNTAELARRVLVKDHDHFQDRYLYSGYSDPLGSLNLFTVKNPIWSNMRHELSPMFTSLRLKKITELMNINSTELVRKVEKDYIKGNKCVDLKELFSMYTSDTVAFSVFGIRVSVLSDQLSPLWAITSHMVKWTFWRGLEFTMIFFMPAVAALFRLKFFSVSASNYIKEIFWNIANDRKSKGTSNDKDLVNHLLKLKDNLKLPAEAGSKLADNLMLAQAAVFILGSVETSSSTLSYCIHELAYHPKEQEKLFREIDEARKSTGKDILEYDELMELKYLSACLNETLRKYPPVAYLDRICNKTYKLNDNVVIEKGIPVFVNVLAIHYDENNFPEPEEWRPERMLASSSDSDNLQFTFLPFGEGPRFCIGKRYGLMQMRTALAQLLHKYKLEPAAPHHVKSDPYSVILAPADGGTVKFVPR